MVRLAFEVLPGRRMEYELLAPPDWDPSKPRPFLISVSGVEQTHVNGFSHRLPREDWVVAVPIRPQSAPLMFEGCGAEGDGIWHLHEFSKHLLRQYKVDTGRFLMVGVSNGGNSVLRFATLWPELCRGVVAVTAALSCSKESLARLRGIPIDMYVGTKDECGFYPPMVELEANLRAASQKPPALLTVFEGAGHCCSPLVDQSLVIGKMLLMLLRSCGVGGRTLTLRPPEPGVLTADEIHVRLRAFGKDLGLDLDSSPRGGLVARLPASPRLPLQLRRAPAGPNISTVSLRGGSAGSAPPLPPPQPQEPLAIGAQLATKQLPTLLGGKPAALALNIPTPSTNASGGSTIGGGGVTPLCRTTTPRSRPQPPSLGSMGSTVAGASPRWPPTSLCTPVGAAGARSPFTTPATARSPSARGCLPMKGSGHFASPFGFPDKLTAGRPPRLGGPMEAHDPCSQLVVCRF
mmetsp:Transcript_102186/g.256164  ORF Transcript_102186/g.256164 Transcript_102186/m.256164 type:complete len:462 (-) Transcript_102186:163-1548(-)